MKFNSSSISIKPTSLVPPQDLLSSDFNMKRVLLEKAKGMNPFLDELLKSCPIQGSTSKILVDARVQHFNKPRPTEFVGWHVDFRLSDPTPDSYEINHLWASNYPTVFSFDDCFDEEIKDLRDLREKVIPKIKNIKQANKYTWYTYDRSRLHKGPLVTEKGSRFFVRVSETMERYR